MRNLLLSYHDNFHYMQMWSFGVLTNVTRLLPRSGKYSSKYSSFVLKWRCLPGNCLFQL